MARKVTSVEVLRIPDLPPLEATTNGSEIPIFNPISGLTHRIEAEKIKGSGVPYTGATADVDLGEFKILAKGIKFPQNPLDIPVDGDLYFDPNFQTLVFKGYDGTDLQFGEEVFNFVLNNTGSTITNGSVCYINGALSGDPTISLVDCRYYNTSRIIGVATQDIANGQKGKITVIGRVNDINTSGLNVGDVIYANSSAVGTFTNTTPTGGCYKVRIGTVLKAGVADGAIELNVNASEYTVEVLRERGFPDKSQVSLTFDDNTGTFTISPVSTDFRFYQNGEPVIKTAPENFVISDIEGGHFIYYNNGVLGALVNGTVDQIKSLLRNFVPVAYIYWNAVDKRATVRVSELHNSIGYGIENHIKDHSTIGAMYGGGFNPNNVAIGGTGNANADAQFGCSNGIVHDEDIEHNISAFLSTVGVSRIYYLNSSNLPRYGTNSGYSVLTSTGGFIAYNPLNSGLVAANSGNYVWYHLFAVGTFDPANGLCTFVGRSQYTTTNLAYAGLSADIIAIQQNGLPSPEFKAIASFLFETKSNFSNAVKGRLIAADILGSAFKDWRLEKLTGGAGTSAPEPVATTTFQDDTFEVYDNADITKKVKFEVENVPTATTRLLGIERLFQWLSNRRIYNAALTFYNEHIISGLTANRTVTWPDKNITVAGLDDLTRLDKYALEFACSDETTAFTTNSGNAVFSNTIKVAFNQTSTTVNLITPPTGSVFVCDIRKNGTSIFSTQPSIDINETSTLTAATPSVLLTNPTSWAVGDVITVFRTQVGSTIAGAGHKVALIGNLI